MHAKTGAMPKRSPQKLPRIAGGGGTMNVAALTEYVKRVEVKHHPFSSHGIVLPASAIDHDTNAMTAVHYCA